MTPIEARYKYLVHNELVARRIVQVILPVDRKYLFELGRQLIECGGLCQEHIGAVAVALLYDLIGHVRCVHDHR